MTPPTIDPHKDSTPWPSALVATALIVLVGSVSIAAINKTPSEVDNVWKTLGTITGVIVGAAATYFFTISSQNRNANALSEMRQNLSKTQAELDQARGKERVAHEAATALFYAMPEQQR